MSDSPSVLCTPKFVRQSRSEVYNLLRDRCTQYSEIWCTVWSEIYNKTTTIAAQIANPPCLPMSDLWTLWDSYFLHRPDYPNRMHVESRLGYKLQEKAYGGLSPETRKQLEAIGARHSKIKLRAAPRKYDLTPGTILLREWGEREHRVRVTADGRFDYEGKNFKSLSAVACHITGTHWSGPLFFGLSGKGGVR